MSIVSSSYLIDSFTQRNGSRWVKESHVDGTGYVYERVYRLPADEGENEAQVRLEANAALLNASLKAEREARFEEGMLNVIAALKRGENPFPANDADFEFGSRLQVLGRMFQTFATASATEIYLWSPFIDAVHDVEFAALGLDEVQIAAVRAKVTELKSLRDVVLAYQPLNLGGA